MDNEECEKAEYDNLNKEILDYSGKIYQVLTFCISTTGALLVIGLNQVLGKVDGGDVRKFLPLISLVPFAVILPSMALVRSSLNATVRIASYIKLLFEEKHGRVGWQTAMQRSRTNRNLRRFARSLCLVFLVLAIVCLALSWFTTYRVGTQGVDVAVPIIASLIVLLFFIRFQYQLSAEFSYKAFEDWETNWERFCGLRQARLQDIRELKTLVAFSKAGEPALVVDPDLIEEGRFYVVVFRKRICAGGCWSRSSEPEDELFQPAARIRSLFVHPDFAGHSPDLLVLDACVNAAAAEGCRHVRLTTTDSAVKMFKEREFKRDRSAVTGMATAVSMTKPLIGGGKSKRSQPKTWSLIVQ